MAIVALLTDFGDSEYAGVLRGVVLSGSAGATVVDLTHQVPPQGVRQGAWLLLQGYRYFPPGTVFCCVVDPGVGSARAALAAQAGAYYFVGPDNGLCYPALRAAASSPQPLRVVALPTPPGASPTFHGRDIFAPAAARLAAGICLEALGEPVAPTPMRFFRRGRTGEVVHIDGFGNAITNLPPLPERQRYHLRLAAGGRSDSLWDVEIPLCPNYAAAPSDRPFLVVGSCGTLEVSWQNGSAVANLPLAVGRHICLD